MCGIVGIWNRDGRPVDRTALRGAVTRLAHRGPDDEGYVLIDTRSGRAVACRGADVVLAAIVVGAVAALWGMMVVQLTPTGGVIMENKTTVNYAMIALHGWIAFYACIVALLAWAIRSVAF